MPKFDLNKWKEKLDLQGMMDSVKSIINPDEVLPKNLEGDPVAAKLALIRTATENLNNLLEQQQKEMAKINTLIASIYKDMQPEKPKTKTPPEDEGK